MPEVNKDQVNTIKTRSAAKLDKKLSEVFGVNITDLYSEENTPEHNNNIPALNEESENTDPENEVEFEETTNIVTMTPAAEIKTKLDNLVPTINHDIKELDEAITAFREAVDDAYSNQNFTPVGDKWNDVRDKWTTAKSHLSTLESIDEDELDKEENKTLLAKVDRYKNKLDKKQETFDENNVFYQNAMKEKKKINQDNQLTKKETMTLSMFNPSHDDWEEFAGLVRQYADGMSMDSQKRNFLLSKMSIEIRNTLANHGSFDDRITSLSHQFGDKIRVTTDRIADFVTWTQKPAASINNLDDVGNEVTEMRAFVARLVNPRGIKCKCDVKDANK